MNMSDANNIDTITKIINKYKQANIPYVFSIETCKVSYYNNATYMRVYADDEDVTTLVAKLCGYRISRATDSKGCMIVQDEGGDIAYSVVNKLGNIVNEWFPMLIDNQNYDVKKMWYSV